MIRLRGAERATGAQNREKLPPSALPGALPTSADPAGGTIPGLMKSGRPFCAPHRYNDPVARVVKLVDTADLKSADAETRRAGSSPALGTPLEPCRGGMGLALDPLTWGETAVR